MLTVASGTAAAPGLTLTRRKERMDASEAGLQALGGGVISGATLLVSKILAWRKEERDEDAKRIERAATAAIEENARRDLQAVKDRVRDLENRQDHHGEQLTGISKLITEMRDGIKEDLAEHKTSVAAALDRMTDAFARDMRRSER